MERLCAELQGLKVAVRSLTDQQQHQSPLALTASPAGPDHWPQRVRELRDALMSDVRAALAEELPQLRQELQELRVSGGGRRAVWPTVHQRGRRSGGFCECCAENDWCCFAAVCFCHLPSSVLAFTDDHSILDV